MIDRIKSDDFQFYYLVIFLISFVFFLLFMQAPFFYELYICKTQGVVNFEDCEKKRELGFFSGIAFIYSSLTKGNDYNYFEDNNIGFVYIVGWIVICVVLSILVVIVFHVFLKYSTILNVLTEEKKIQLSNFFGNTVKVLESLKNETRFDSQKKMYSTILKKIKNSNFVFYDRAALRFNYMSDEFYKHCFVFSLSKKSVSRIDSKDSNILLPAWKVFDKERLTVNGMFYIWREFAKKVKDPFLSILEMKDLGGEAHIYFPDIFSIIIAKRLGFKENEIKNHVENQGNFKKLMAICDIFES
ncbi:MAG: hypothetical protein N3D73_00080 [Candidatus Diapherotrites archaeon]|nr:hypothetical protein [Candidatus Diapherotrites archaeon]